MGRFEAERVIKRLAAVPEPGMRVALLRECFLEGLEAEVEAVLRALLAAVAQRLEVGQLAYLALAKVVGESQVRERLTSLSLVDQAFEAVLAQGHPQRQAESGELTTAPLRNDREVTLGERRSLARGRDRNLLERLLFDLDLGVLRNLLMNPRIVERDVLKVASRRPNSAAILTLLFEHPRWGTQRAIQAALVQNPYSPLKVALPLVELQERECLRVLADEPAVHPLVRARASERLTGTNEQMSLPQVYELEEEG